MTIHILDEDGNHTKILSREEKVLGTVEGLIVWSVHPMDFKFEREAPFYIHTAQGDKIHVEKVSKMFHMVLDILHYEIKDIVIKPRFFKAWIKRVKKEIEANAIK